MNEKVNGWKSERIKRWMDEKMNEYVKEWMTNLMNAWIDEWE